MQCQSLAISNVRFHKLRSLGSGLRVDERGVVCNQMLLDQSVELERESARQRCDVA